jgi:hypothetical protein
MNFDSQFENLKAHAPPRARPAIVIPKPSKDHDKKKCLFPGVIVRSARVEIPATILVNASTGDEFPFPSDLVRSVELAFNCQNVGINKQSPMVI